MERERIEKDLQGSKIKIFSSSWKLQIYVEPLEVHFFVDRGVFKGGFGAFEGGSSDHISVYAPVSRVFIRLTFLNILLIIFLAFPASLLYTPLFPESLLYTPLFQASLLYTPLFPSSLLYTPLFPASLLYTPLFPASLLYTPLFLYKIAIDR